MNEYSLIDLALPKPGNVSLMCHGVYRTQRDFCKRMAYDYASGFDVWDFEQTFVPHVVDGPGYWGLPFNCFADVQGEWVDAGFGENGDPMMPDWADLGIPDGIRARWREPGVFYYGDYMVVQGVVDYIGHPTFCWWVFEGHNYA